MRDRDGLERMPLAAAILASAALVGFCAPIQCGRWLSRLRLR
jgi:hypothetical protein